MAEVPVSSPSDSRRVEELEQTLRSLREDSEVAHVLLGLAGVLAEVRSVEETLEMTVRIVPELLGADRCYVVKRVGGSNRFRILDHSGFDDGPLAIAEGYAAKNGGLPLLLTALKERTPLLVPDALEDSRIDADAVRERGFRAYVALPLVRWGEEFGALALEYSEPRDFTSRDTALARGIARQVGQALVNSRRFNLLAGLRTFGLDIASKLSLNTVIQDVAEGAEQLLSGDAATLYFLDSTSGVLAAPPGGVSKLPGNGEGFGRIDITAEPWSGLSVGRTVAVPNIIEADENGESWSAVAAPVVGERGALTGAVVVFFKRSIQLAPDEAEALSVLAGQASMSIDNARRFERQRRMARSLQQGLLLTELPEVPHTEVAAVYDPASGEADIGGDFYDVFDLPDGRFAIVVGDVSGKGAEAAARTAMAKYMLRAFSTRNAAPSSVLFHLNNALAHDLEEERFATLVYAVLDPRSGRITFGVAGHPPPLIYRHDVPEIETIELQGGILGAFEDEQYQQETYQLGSKDLLLVFTDGLIEARSDAGEFYGRKRIEQELLRYGPVLSIPELTSKILNQAKEFGPLSDDTVVFALRSEGAP
jgi:GAF domain-containing protein